MQSSPRSVPKTTYRIFFPSEMRFAEHPQKHSLPSLSLIHFCALLSFRLSCVSSSLALPASSPSLAYLLTTAYNDRTLYPGSLDHSYHPHLYHLTAYVHVSVPDSLPHFLHAVFARCGPCSLYTLIVDTMSYYVPPYMHTILMNLGHYPPALARARHTCC